MASFIKALENLLSEAGKRQLIAPDAADSLLTLARERERSHGLGRLAAAICLIGGLGLFLGLVLIMAANWDDIPASAKLTTFFLLFLGTHGGGILLRRRHPDGYRATADALNFLGGGLFLCGLGLVSQIYNINDDPARGVAAWFLATLPLAVLLRSTPLGLMALAAGIVWIHMRSVRFIDVHESLLILLEVCLPVAVIGLGSLGDRVSLPMGRMCRVVGSLWLAASMYCLGFFRHADIGRTFNRHPENLTGVLWVCLGLLLAGVAGAVAVCFRRDPGRAAMNRALAVLLLACVTVAALAFGVMSGWLLPGEGVDVYAFGTFRRAAYHSIPLFLTVLVWVLWFGLSLWLVFDGSARGRNGMVTAGVYGTALGLFTRYFDLLGGLAYTGAAFTVGGIMLLILGWGAEKWRRKLTKKA